MKKQRPKSKIIEFPKTLETPEEKQIREAIEADIMFNVGPPNLKRRMRIIKRIIKDD